MWLPLVAKHTNNNLVPPLDIHWIWHCHMLAPYYYEKDTLRCVGTVPDHKLFNKETYRQGLQITEAVWNEEYRNEPFHIDLHGRQGIGQPSEGFESKCNYNLREAVGRQRMFYYQVSLPHYRDDKFLTEAVKRYMMFLKLVLNH